MVFVLFECVCVYRRNDEAIACLEHILFRFVYVCMRLLLAKVNKRNRLFLCVLPESIAMNIGGEKKKCRSGKHVVYTRDSQELDHAPYYISNDEIRAFFVIAYRLLQWMEFGETKLKSIRRSRKKGIRCLGCNIEILWPTRVDTDDEVFPVYTHE